MKERNGKSIRWLFVVAAVCLVFGATACGKDNPPPKAEVTVSLPSTLTLTEGESQQLTPEISGTTETPVWASDKTEIAVVVDGLVTAVSAGQAYVTVSVGDKSAACKVIVTPAPEPDVVYTIRLDKQTESIATGDAKRLTATVTADGITIDTMVVWSSDNEAVATVDNEGLVTAAGEGEATITAAAFGQTAVCTVTVAQVVYAVGLNTAALTLDVKDSRPLTATVTADGKEIEATVVWTSDDESVATVDDNGLITAVAEGETTITAAAFGQTATCTVTTRDVVTLALDATALSFRTVDKQVEIAAIVTVNGEEKNDAAVEFVSSADTVVSVTPQSESATQAVVKSLASGTAVITASYRGQEAECAVTVEDTSTYTRIYTAADFLGINDNLAGKYLLMNDIDMGGIRFGGGTNKMGVFTGVLDGNGFTVSDFGVAFAYQNGMFTGLTGATVRNIGFDFDFSPDGLTGLFGQDLKSCTIENARFDVRIPGYNSVVSDNCGILGVMINNGVQIRNCIVNVESVTGTGADSISSDPKLSVIANHTQWSGADSGVENCIVIGQMSNIATLVGGGTTQIKLNNNVHYSTAEGLTKSDFAAWDNAIWTIPDSGLPQLTVLAELTLNAVAIELNDTETFTLTAVPADDVIWKSSDLAVATVENGVVTPVGPGTVTISAERGRWTAKCTVNVVWPVEISLNKTAIGFKKAGEQEKLIAIATSGTEIVNVPVVWTSSNPDVANVDSGGTVTSIAGGYAEITGTYGESSAVCAVNVIIEYSW